MVTHLPVFLPLAQVGNFLMREVLFVFVCVYLFLVTYGLEGINLESLIV